jgi:protein-disulfide isomerase
MKHRPFVTRAGEAAFLVLLIYSAGAAGVAGSEVWTRGSSSQSGAAIARPVPTAAVSVVADGGVSVGPANAARSIIVFWDFECPYCRRFAMVLDSLHAAYPTVRIVERNYPLTAIHPKAMIAAFAGECGIKFHAYLATRRALFARHDLIAEGQWGSIARVAGIADSAAFRDCVESGYGRAAIQTDVSAGRAAGITGTPTIVVGDSLIAGSLSLGQLVDRLTREGGIAR